MPRYSPLESLARELAHRTNEPDFSDTLRAVSGQDAHALTEAYLEHEVTANDASPAWIVGSMFDEIDTDDDGQQDRQHIRSLRLLAAIKDGHATIALAILQRALRIRVAREVAARTNGISLIEHAHAQGRAAFNHYDAIGADRRALAAEFNRSL